MMQKEIEFLLAVKYTLKVVKWKIPQAKNFGNMTQKDMRLPILRMLRLKRRESLLKYTNINFG